MTVLATNPNRKFLHIELMTDPVARDCVEDILASVISWWGRRYEVMFASSWGFAFRPRSGGSVGHRLDAEISPSWKLLETYHGIKVSIEETSLGTDLFALVVREIDGGRPVVLSRGGERSSSEPGSAPRFVLALGFDRLRKVLFYRAPDVPAEGPQRRNLVHTLPHQQLDDWRGPHVTFFGNGSGAAELDWRRILKDAAWRFHNRAGSSCRLEMMASFAREVASMDIESEVGGYDNWYWVPLFYNLRRVSQGRIQFLALLEFFAARFDLGETSRIRSGFENAGRSWQLVRSLMIKYSLTVEDRSLLERISARILDIAAAERQLAQKLILIADGSRTTWAAPDSISPKGQMHAVSPFRPEEGHVAPRSAIEKRLARIWEEVLGMETVGIRANFFELGGDSLLGMKILARMHQTGLEIDAGQIYQHQTIEELAAVTGTNACRDTDQEPETGSMPFLPLQYKGISENGPDYGREGAVKFYFSTIHDLTSDQLGRVTDRLSAHHDALRLRFPRDFEDRRPWFGAPESDSRCWRWIDVSDYRPAGISEILHSTPEAARSVIDLHQGPLFLLLYFRTPPQMENVLCMCVHHIVSDAISNGILEEDILSLMDQASGHGKLRLPRKTTSIKQWSNLLFNYARSQAPREIDYWKSRPWGRTRPLLPYGSNGLPVDLEKVISVDLTVSARMTRHLFNTCRALKISIHELLLAALARTLACWSGSNVVLIEHIHHGRDPVFKGTDLSRTVGFFSLEVPLVLELPASDGLEILLGEVSSQIRRLPAKGMGYSLLRYLSKDMEIVRFLESIPAYQARYNAVIEPRQGDPAPDGKLEGGLDVQWQETSTSPTRIAVTPFTLENKPRMEKGGLVLPLRFGQKGLFHKETVVRAVNCYARCLEGFAKLDGGVRSMKPSHGEWARSGSRSVDRLATLPKPPYSNTSRPVVARARPPGSDAVRRAPPG